MKNESMQLESSIMCSLYGCMCVILKLRESKHGVFGWVGRCVFAQIGYCKIVLVRGTKKNHYCFK